MIYIYGCTCCVPVAAIQQYYLVSDMFSEQTKAQKNTKAKHLQVGEQSVDVESFTAAVHYPVLQLLQVRVSTDCSNDSQRYDKILATASSLYNSSALFVYKNVVCC